MLLVVLCADIFFIALITKNQIKSKDYIEVDAEVIDVEVKQNDDANSKSSTRYIEIKYSVDGKEYTAKKRMLLMQHCRIGETIKVKYNAVQTDVIYDNYNNNVYICMVVFLSVFMAGGVYSQFF